MPIQRLRRGATAVSAAMAVSALALAGCGGANNPSTAQAAGGGGTLTIEGDAGNPQLVENFNPFVPATELHGAYLIYEPLEIRSPIDGSYTPYLATTFSFTNPTTLVFTIRKGVKWSDGKPFTEKDVVFTFKMLKEHPALDSTGIWAQVAGVSGSGDKVTFKLKKPNVPFAGVIAGTPIVPEHLWSSIAKPAKFADTHPVGTGPFVLGTFAPTQYTLKKNPTYWQASKVAPKTVVFPAQSSNQSTNQLDVTSGKFDWSYNFLPNVKKTYVARDPKHNIYWFPPGGTIGLFLNLTRRPYNNVNFRRGISLALNRNLIAKKAVNGYMSGASQSGLILPNLQKWLDPSIPDKGNVTQNTAAALAAFKKAGYSKHGTKLVNTAGQQASMTITVPNNFSDWVAASTEIVNELKALGFAAKVDTPQYAQYQSSIQDGTFDAALGGYGGTGDPYTDFDNALNSSFAAPIHTSTANNFERYKNPAADAALAKLAAANNTGSQRSATDELQRIMYNQVPIVLVYYGGSWGLFSTKHFTGWPSAADPYTLPTNYNNSLLTVLTHLKAVGGAG